jgi:hypothetical protein
MRNSSVEDLNSIILDDFIDDDDNNKTNMTDSYSIRECFINCFLCCFISLN